MHVVFDPDAIDWHLLLNSQSGGGAYFIGVPYQRGGGIGAVFSSLFRFLLPALKSAGKELGKEGLAVGARVLGSLAEVRPLRDSVITEASEGLRNLVDRTNPTESLKTEVSGAESRLKQKGGGGLKRSAVSVTHLPATGRSVKRKRLDQLGYY